VSSCVPGTNATPRTTAPACHQRNYHERYRGGTHRASGGAPDGDHHVSPPCVLLHMARLTWQEESCREGQSGCEASRRTVIQCSPCAWRVRRMAGKACPPLVRVLAAMPAKALLARCRATARSESASACQQVGRDALNAASQGALAPLCALSRGAVPGRDMQRHHRAVPLSIPWADWTIVAFKRSPSVRG
jgi:hypothetical protein